MAAMPAVSVVPQVKAGKVKMLAVSTPKRSPYLPDVPTLMESSIDVEADAWMGLMEPVGNSPQEFRARINGEIGRWSAVIKAVGIKPIN